MPGVIAQFAELSAGTHLPAQRIMLLMVEALVCYDATTVLASLYSRSCQLTCVIFLKSDQLGN